MREVAVLFARADSVYKTLPGCDVWDEARDARQWQGGAPVVAHPPCRAWGSLRHFAKPAPGEKELALFAVDQVRRFGGVLEHPARSSLWPAAGLPAPGQIDDFGGFTYPISQHWFGHRAEKLTFLYVCGCRPADFSPPNIVMGPDSHVIAQSRALVGGGRKRKGMPNWRPEVTKAEREQTPPLLAAWLVDIARRVN